LKPGENDEDFELKIVFMGTAQFAVPALQALLESGQEIAGVITQPDKPRGRGHKLAFSPVKEYAVKQNLEVFQPARIDSEPALLKISEWQPEMIVVVAYGQIIPARILSLPVHGCINVHGSLLPRYRGAAPIQRALMAGEAVTGVTTMYMDQGLDTGDMIKKATVPIDGDIDYGELHDRLAEVGADLLLETIAAVADGTAAREKQDSSQATYAPVLRSNDELICWQMTAQQIHNQIRALSPLPGAYTSIEGNKLKVYKSRVTSLSDEGTPGLVKTTGSGFLVQTGQGLVELLEVQKEGRKRMPARDFAAGQRIPAGLILGS
jgi:methionyl-tRNA formyltransferase